MDALVTFGTIFTSTGNFNLSSLLTIIYSLFLKPYLEPLTVNTTFISQSLHFALTAADVDKFLNEQFGEESSKWSCTLVVKLKRYNGPARNAFQVTLRHNSVSHESPLRELDLRLLCAKLVGIHRIDEISFQILPAHVRGPINEVDKAFGSSLLLMHLKAFHNEQYRPRDDDWRMPENEWIKYILEALEAFTDGYNRFSEFLTNEDFLDILGLVGLDDRMKELGKILLKLLEAWKKKSEKDIKSCKKDLEKFDMREKIDLMRKSFDPVVKFGKNFNVILETMDDCGSPDSEIEELSKALLHIKACLVPFRGALGVLMTEVGEQKHRYRTWNIISWAAFLPLFAAAPPLGVGAFAAFVYCGEKSEEKRRELEELSELDEAGKALDAMSSCTRLYLVLVILKATNFFDLTSAEGREYQLLMAEIFKIDLGDENFQINHYIKMIGFHICSHLKFLHRGLDALSDYYGLRPSERSTDW